MKLRLLLGIPLLCVIVLNWWPGFDQAAAEYLDQSLADSLVIYASARGLNAIISVLQSVHISVSLGAGVGLNLGEALDPLNDLIERFSSFVLYGLAAIGLQKLVLTGTSSLLMKVLATGLILAGYLIWVLRERLWSQRLLWVIKAALIVALVRFFLIVEVGTVYALDQLYFNEQEAHARSALDLARTELAELRQSYLDNVAEGGLMGGIRGAAGSVFGDDQQQGVADLAAGAVVELIVIMLVRAIIMPLLFVWLLITLMRRLAGMPTTRRMFEAELKAES